MATLANLETLRFELRKIDVVECPHVWIGEDGKLEIGVFPVASLRFCFADERVQRLDASEPPTGETAEKPSEQKKTTRDVRSKAARKTERICLSFADVDLICGSAKQALLEGLSEVEKRVPGTLDKISRLKGRSKRPVHRDRNMLYDLPSQAKYSEKIASGHWVATNNKRREALEVLEVAAEVASVQLAIK